MSESKEVIGVVMLGVIALVGVMVVGLVAAQAMSMGNVVGSEEVRDFETGEEYVIDKDIDEEPSTIEVTATRENAVYLQDGAYVADSSDGGWAQGNWSVLVTADLDSQNEQARYTTFAYDNESIVVEYYDGQWRALHNVGDEWAVANVTADAPNNYTSLSVSWDNSTSTLTLIEDGVDTDSGMLGPDAPERTVANEWEGSVDELRLINQTVSSTHAQAYAADPVTPLNVEHSARYMFNEGEGSDTYVYYSGSKASLVGATWTEGVEGPSLESGTDYAIGTPLSITVLDGGYLDGAPTLFIDYESGTGAMLASVVGGMGDAFSLIPIILIAMMASILLGIVNKVR